MEQNWFTVKQITTKLFGIGEFNHFEKVISYLFVGTTKAVLFDTGLGVKNIRHEVKKITQLPIIVLNSHSHYDHVGGNSKFNIFITSNTSVKFIMKSFRFIIIKTPGHTPDSLCVYERTIRLLLSGDTVYNGPIYLHFKESNLMLYKNSIAKLVAYCL